MARLLMITGLGSAVDLASGKKGAFYNTLEEFHKYWNRVDIICPRVKREKLKVKSLFGNVFIHVSPWPLVFHPFWFLKKGLEIYKEQKFDLMTVQDFPPFYNGIGARLLWNRIRVPYVLEFHHIPGYPRVANFKEKIYANEFIWKFYWNIFGSKAKTVRVVNQKQTPEFLKKAGMPKEKIVYIPSMYIDLEIFKPLNLEKKYDLIFVGRLEKNKGIKLLLKAVKLLKEHSNILQNVGMSVKLLIVGSGSLKKELVNFVETNGLKENVFFSGWLATSEDVAKAYSSARIFVNQ